MNQNHNASTTVIRKSCLTGKAVWIYRGPSERSAGLAYWRACRQEMERMRRFSAVAARRFGNIARILSDCMAGLPVNAELTAWQKEAVRQLQAIQKKGIACHRDFYEHIMEERSRRAADREIRRRMREREKST